MFEALKKFASPVVVLVSIAAAAGPAQAAPGVSKGPDVPNVIVSIAPVHSLVAAVMSEVGVPGLLLPANASPHAYSLRPSDAQALAAADIVFRVGPNMETFLDKSLTALAAGTVVTLADAPGLSEQPSAADNDDRREEAHADEDRGHGGDPHIWLGIDNARRIAEIAAATLSRHDPANTATYQQNLTRLKERLNTLERDLRDLLAPVGQRPYVVMHDAYSHFEAEFGLQSAAAISISPERRPGARRLREIRDLLAAANIRCVFTEPQYPNTIAATVVDGTNARLAALDPIGVGLPPGPDLYFTLMKNLGRSLAGCLAQ